MSEIKRIINKYFDSLNIIIGLLIIFGIIFWSLAVEINNGREHNHQANSIANIEKVDIVTNREYLKDVSLPSLVELDGDYDVILDLSKYLGKKKKSIFTYFLYADVEVYADNEIIFQRKKADNSITKSNGYSCVIFDLPENIKSPYVRIHFMPNLDHIATNPVYAITIGRKSDIIVKNLTDDLFGIVVSVCLIINFMIIIAFIMNKKAYFKKENYSLLHLAILGLLFAIYYITQIKIIIYFAFDFAELMYFLEFISFGLVLVPVVSYVKYKVDKKYKIYLDIISVILVLNILVQIILTVLKVIEFKELLYLSYFLMFITLFLLSIAIIFSDKEKMVLKKNQRISIFAMIIIIIISMVYYFLYGSLLFNKLAIILLLAVIVIEYIEIYDKYKYFEKEQLMNDFYKKLAITDALTGLFNRKAYQDFVDKMKKEKISGYLISIDINNLKYINDKFGHITGDELITSFAEIVKQKTKDLKGSKVFRWGGDEFFIFIADKKKFDIDSFIEEMKHEYGSLKSFGLDFAPSFSAGYGYYDAKAEKNIMEIWDQVDKMMYKDKEKYKKLEYYFE